jgi:peptidyl-prolyl cis-trans isomerase SDCCAG10
VAARGLVSTAPGPRGHSSQFFVTLAPNVPLERTKHSIFGKVVGDSVFNLIKANECVVGEDDRPLYPPVIHRAEVIDNPFPDLAPRPGVVWRTAAEQTAERKKTRQPRRKNTNMLSFGEEGEEELLGAAEGGHLLRMQPREGSGAAGAAQAEPELKKARVEKEEEEKAPEEEEKDVADAKESKKEKKDKKKKKKKKKEKEKKSKKKEKKEKKEKTDVKPLFMKAVPPGALEEKGEEERAREVAKFNEKKLKQRSAQVTKKQQEETAAKFAAFRKQLAKK